MKCDFFKTFTPNSCFKKRKNLTYVLETTLHDKVNWHFYQLHKNTNYIIITTTKEVNKQISPFIAVKKSANFVQVNFLRVYTFFMIIILEIGVY